MATSEQNSGGHHPPGHLLELPLFPLDLPGLQEEPRLGVGALDRDSAQRDRNGRNGAPLSRRGDEESAGSAPRGDFLPTTACRVAVQISCDPLMDR